jgi:hypothetical protein
LLDDPTGAIVCHVRPVKDLDGASPEAFRLLQCSVNGEPLATRRTVRVKSQTFTARLGVPRGFRTVHPIGWTVWKGKVIASTEEELLS